MSKLKSQNNIENKILSSLLPFFDRKNYNHEEQIWKKGDKNCKIVYLESGSICIFDLDKIKCKKVERVIKDNCIIGLTSALSDQRSLYYAEALTDCKCYETTKLELFNQLKVNNDLSLQILKLISNRYLQLNDLMNHFSNSGSLQTTASYFYSLLSDNHQENIIEIPLSLNKLSKVLGIASISLNRNINILIQKKLIFRIKKNQFEIRYPDKLLELSTSCLLY